MKIKITLFMALLFALLLALQSCKKQTDLQVTVYYENTETPVANCDVDLFSSYQDWNALDKAVDYSITDDKGSVTFRDVSNISYYVSLYKSVSGGFYSNWDSDAKIVTDKLEEGRLNKYKFYVRYSVSNLKSGDKKSEWQVIKVERER